MSDTLKVFGKTFTGVNGIKAKDPNGNTITYTNGGGGSSATLGTKSITANGTYNASSDNYDGYSSVTVNVEEDLPIFTSIYNTATDTTINTCNKSYSDCITNYYHAILIEVDNPETFRNKYYMNRVELLNDSVIYVSYENGRALGHIRYYSNGNIEYEMPSDRYDLSLIVTAAGEYVPNFGAYSWVEVQSGSASTPATSITANPTISVNSSTGLITASVSSSQNVTPTVSAGYVSSGTAGTVSVSGSDTEQLSVQTGTTITPTESEQTAVAAGKYTTGAVKVGAISSTYVGSGITSRSSSDLTASGATVTVPAGYYASQATKSVASGSATPTSSISGTAATVTTGTNTLTLSKTVSNTPQVSAGYVSAGTAGNSSVSLTANVTTKDAATITPGTTNQTIASGTYLTGTQTIAGDADLVAGNIKSGVSIFGVTGSLAFQTIYTGSSTPSSSTGVNGDIYIKTS